MKSQKTLFIASLSMAFAIIFGAFGAHGLKGKISELALETYKTGVLYHIIHSLGLFALGTIEILIPRKSFKLSKISFLLGILFFSFGCYFYSLTGMRWIAIIPIGGTLFIIGWFALAYQLGFSKNTNC